MNLSIRQKKILSLIIREYSKYSEPVGSCELQEKYFADLSPATLRRELSFLSKKGYLNQPHTSAGRIPTDKAYRWFVEETITNEKEMEKQSNKWLGKIKKDRTQIPSPAQAIAQFCDGFGVSVSLEGEIHKYGLKNLFNRLRAVDFSDLEGIFEDIELLDFKIEEFLDEFKDQERMIFIGRESPFTRSENLSIISRVSSLEDNPKIFMLIGPKNMLYARNIAILEAISNLDF